VGALHLILIPVYICRCLQQILDELNYVRETVRKRAEEERTRAAGEKAAKRKALKEQEQRAHDAQKALSYLHRLNQAKEQS